MRFNRSARWLILALLVCLIPATSRAGVFISVNFGPPVLPVYVQPVCPQPNLIWTPGYWAYGDDGYFWVPGAWVPAPFVGGLWTPGYWGWGSGLYMYHPGYWGYHVGYYGGVNYGGGYLGIGFAGGEWRGGAFAYNTAVVNVNTTIIHNTFVDRTVVERYTVANPNHVAYAGGPGGINHPAVAEERVAERETHTPPTTFQAQHIQSAQTNKQSYAKFNGGHPATLAVAKPLAVENHPAPPLAKAAVNTGAAKNSVTPMAAKPTEARPNTTEARPNTTEARPNAIQARPNSTEARPNTTTARPNTTFTPRPNTSSPPRTTEMRPAPSVGHNNSAPPRAPAPPKENRPPAKPKPEGHEK